MEFFQGAVIQKPLLIHISQVSIYASPDKRNQTHYALQASLKLLDFYEKYFDINYPLPKLGMFKFHIIVFIFAHRTRFDFFPLSLSVGLK